MTPSNVVLIFGGTKGLGKAIASRFVIGNYKVVVSSSKEANVHQAVLELRHQRRDASDDSLQLVHGFQCDVQDENAVKEVLKVTEETVDAVDILVNAAGINLDKLLIQTQNKDIESVLGINLVGTMTACRVVLKSMLKRRKGSIINIGSIVGLKGNAGQTVYSASKSGLVGFTKSLAREVAIRGIGVNMVAPGLIQTEMTANIDWKRFQSIVPLQRIGMSEDVAEAVWFLAHSPYITGEVLVVDGGLHLNI